MGHSDINVTLGTYVHPLSEQRQETTDEIAARVFGADGDHSTATRKQARKPA